MDMKIAAKIMSVLSISMFLSNTVAYSQDRTGIVAHRGFWNCEEAGFSENSIAALRCAQEAGFRGSEFDVNMTSDKQLIVFHDNSVEGKRIEDHPFSDFTYYRLPNGEPIPTLDQYLEQGKESAETMLVCELKPHSSSDIENKLVGRTIACIDAHGLLDPKRVMFISFSFHMCRILALLLPDFTIQYLGSDKSPRKVWQEGINGIDYHHYALRMHPRWIRIAHERKMSVNTWTVNKKGTMEKMLERKVDFITTDNPLIAKELIESNEPR